MSTISEEEWKRALTEILEDLDESQYKTMMFSLLEIGKRVKTTKSREEMPQVIIEHYGVERSVHEIHKIMDQIPRRDPKVQGRLRPFVERLKKKQEDERRESVSSSSRKRKVDKTESAGSVMPKKKKVSSLKSTPATKTTKAEKPKKKENNQKAKKKGQKHFVDEHRNELTRRVTNIAPILDDLLQEDIIDDEVYDDVRAHRTSQKQMRELFSHIVKAGDASKEAFYQVLTRHQKMLIEDLIQNSTK